MVYPIITETVPTLAGMGVVSRTTETMFGKGKKGKRVVSRRRRVATKARLAGPRKFGGKAYQAANWHTAKAAAERDAGYFRKQGHSARVVRSYNARLKKWGYMVYVR